MSCWPQQGTLGPLDDPSAGDVPPVFATKTRHTWKWIGVGVLAIVLFVLTTAVVYLCFQDASTDNAINYKTLVVEEMKGELLRLAEAIRQQRKKEEATAEKLSVLSNESNTLKLQVANMVLKEEATAEKLSVLSNESNTLKLQVANMVLKEEAMDRKMSALVNETDSLRLLVAYVLVKENVTAQRTSAILDESELLKGQLSDIIERMESALGKISAREMTTQLPASPGQVSDLKSKAGQMSSCAGLLLLLLAYCVGTCF